MAGFLFRSCSAEARSPEVRAAGLGGRLPLPGRAVRVNRPGIVSTGLFWGPRKISISHTYELQKPVSFSSAEEWALSNPK